MITCTCCGASWDESGFYLKSGVMQQPCKECHRDTVSVNYYLNQTSILEKRYQDYHSPEKHEAKKAYFRDYYHRKKRQQATA